MHALFKYLGFQPSSLQMNLTYILEYIEKNPTGITILVGVSTSLMVGIWAVFKFFYNRRKNDGSDSENSKSNNNNAINYGSGSIVQVEKINIQSNDPEGAKIISKQQKTISELAEKLGQETSKPATEPFEDSYQKIQRMAQLKPSLIIINQIANTRSTLAQQAEDLLSTLSQGENLTFLLPPFDNFIKAYEEGPVAESVPNLVKLNAGRAVLSFQNYPQDSLQAYNRIIELDPDNIEAHQNIGLILQRLGDMKEAEKALKRSLSLAEKTGTKFKIASCSLSLGCFEQESGKSEKAKTLYQKSLDICIELQDKDGIASCYQNLGVVQQTLRKFEESKTSQQKTLDMFIEMQNKEGIANCFTNLGHLERVLGKLKKAKQSFQKSLDFYKELQHKQIIANCYQSLGVVEDDLGEL